MLEYIVSLLGWASVGVLWITSEPGVKLRELIIDERKASTWFTRLISCCMCSSFHIYFWSQLIINGRLDILGASMVSILAELICRKINEFRL